MKCLQAEVDKFHSLFSYYDSDGTLFLPSLFLINMFLTFIYRLQMEVKWTELDHYYGTPRILLGNQIFLACSWGRIKPWRGKCYLCLILSCGWLYPLQHKKCEELLLGYGSVWQLIGKWEMWPSLDPLVSGYSTVICSNLVLKISDVPFSNSYWPNAFDIKRSKATHVS